MKIIDWRETDPTPWQQIRTLVAHVPRAIAINIAWAGEGLAWHLRDLAGGIHSVLCRAMGRPDPRDVTYELDARALRRIQEVTRDG